MKPFSDEQEQFIVESLSNPAIVKWLSKFSSDCTETFLADYYKQRQSWLDLGEHYRKEHHEWLTIDMQRAETALFYIQQKKLFDLQCLWRAEQEKVPGVQYSGQFCLLELKIKTLDFLPPITGEEVELLKDWLTDWKTSRSLYPEFGWQDYHSFIRNNCENDYASPPPYYQFVDERMKTVPLWKVLPDIRGKKETEYKIAAREARWAASEAGAPSYKKDTEDEEFDHKPYLSVYGPEVEEFVKNFEDHHVNECRVAYEHKRFIRDDRDVEFALESLQNAQGPVPMIAHPNWREGLLLTAWTYERNRLVKAIDVAYENYCFRRQMGIGYAEPDQNARSRCLGDPEGEGMEILDGREALGEPRDYNF